MWSACKNEYNMGLQIHCAAYYHMVEDLCMLVVVVVLVVVGVGIVVKVLLLVVHRVLVGAVVFVLMVYLLQVVMFLSNSF